MTMLSYLLIIDKASGKFKTKLDKGKKIMQSKMKCAKILTIYYKHEKEENYNINKYK